MVSDYVDGYGGLNATNAGQTIQQVSLFALLGVTGYWMYLALKSPPRRKSKRSSNRTRRAYATTRKYKSKKKRQVKRKSGARMFRYPTMMPKR